MDLQITIIDLISLLIALVSLVISLVALRQANTLTKQSIVKPLLMQELVELVKLSWIVKGNQADIKDVHHLLNQYLLRSFALRYFKFDDDLNELLSAWNRMIASAQSEAASSMNPKLVQEAIKRMILISEKIEKSLATTLDNPLREDYISQTGGIRGR
jgi:hypothetical protein